MRYAISFKEIVDECGNHQLCYGIDAINCSNEIVFSISDITFDMEKLQNFVCELNILKLELIHLRDVVEDFIFKSSALELLIPFSEN
ncbi:MAG: DUF6514 family protein [Oscillospiraceae bacterium]